MRNCSLYYLEHAGGRDFRTLGGNQVILRGLDLKVVSKGRLQANVIERCHLVAVLYFARIKNRPLRQLSDGVATFLVLLILLDTHLAITLECEEVAFGGLKADRRAEGDRLLRVSILKIKQRELFALAHFQVRDLVEGR